MIITILILSITFISIVILIIIFCYYNNNNHNHNTDETITIHKEEQEVATRTAQTGPALCTPNSHCRSAVYELTWPSMGMPSLGRRHFMRKQGARWLCPGQNIRTILTGPFAACHH